MVNVSCPLCCNETFSSLAALRIHINSILDTIFCPACNNKFESLAALAHHLENCTFGGTAPANQQNEEDDSITQITTEILLKNEHIEQTNEDMEEEVDDEETQQETMLQQGSEYFCQMCQMEFSDIENHLREFHEGEEIILEEENQQAAAPEEDPLYLIEPNNEEDELETEELLPDKEGRLYARKFVKIDKFWMQQETELKEPLIQKYIVENGEVRKLAEAESEEIADKASIIEINQCPDCNVLFPLLDVYKQHKCESAASKFKCKVCLKLFLSQKEVLDHVNSTHGSGSKAKAKKKSEMGPFECHICTTLFPTFKSLRLHKRMHDPIKTREIQAPVSYEGDADDKEREMFECDICNKSYDKQYEVIHMKSHDSDDNAYNCGICNRKFYTQQNLDMHVKAHTNNKKFSCSYCKKAFISYESLVEHFDSTCQKRCYACQYCGRRFSRPHEKVKHERIHTGEKPHVCDICGKSFRVSYCLTLHLRTHSGARPYHCKVCGKRFKSHSVYNHHMLTHSDERKYKCPFCPKAFKTSVQLAGHKNSHTKPFSCQECNRPFASLYAVRAHQETHLRENSLKFDCWICGALYSRTFALKDHIKQQHPDADLGERVEGEEQEMEAALLVDQGDLLGLEANGAAARIEIIEQETG